MPLRNTETGFGTITKTLHWLMALAVLAMIPLGLAANSLAEALREPGAVPTEAAVTRAVLLFSAHKTLGVLIFATALLRILWALTQPRPGLLHPDRRAEAFLAQTVHWLLYGSLLLVPLTGWIEHAATSGFAPILLPIGQDLPLVPKDDALAERFAALHQMLVWVLAGAIALHVAGALKHHLVDRDATLRRMLPGQTAAVVPPGQRHGPAPFVAALVIWAATLAGGAALGAFAVSEPHQGTQQTLGTPQSDWQVREGTLSIAITQMGRRVDGSFADWTAAIRFEETETPGPAGSVSVQIAVASLVLGSVTQQAMGADFLDATTHPTARFEADITRDATGYVATGPLTIRDQSVQVSLPFDLKITGDSATATGTLHIDRLDFGIGSTLPDEGTLAFDVEIGVNLTADRP